MNALCIVSHFVVFCQTQSAKKCINIDTFGNVPRIVQRETILLQYSHLTVKIYRKGHFFIFAKNPEYCFQNISNIVKTITKAINLYSNIRIKRCVYKIKNVQFHANFQLKPEQIDKFIHHLKSNESFPQSKILLDQQGGECSHFFPGAKHFNNIKIYVTYENKTKSSITIHHTGKITGVCPGVDPFLTITECLQSSWNHVK